MTEPLPTCQPPDPDTRTPRIKAPPGACDTHCHVYGARERYPLAATRRYDPPLCTVEHHNRMLTVLGVERAVLVQASPYATDNSAMLDAVAAMGGRYRGIAVVDPDVGDDELERLNAGGVRGVRMSTLPRSRVGPEHMETIARRIARLGWLVQLHLDESAHLVELAGRVAALGVPVIIDHLGRVRGGEGVGAPGFQALLRLLGETDGVWAKLCSFYRLSDEGGPAYSDMAGAARALVAARPDRLIWGTNWPHPNHEGPMPNDGDLFDVLFGWIPDEPARRAILADNPARLFGFDATGE